MTTSTIALALLSMGALCPTSPNSAGPGMTIRYDQWQGTIRAQHGPPYGWAVLGFSSGVNNLPFGNGTLCLDLTHSNSGLLQVVPINVSGWSIHTGVPLTNYLQVLYRDPVTLSMNASNSIWMW